MSENIMNESIMKSSRRGVEVFHLLISLRFGCNENPDLHQYRKVFIILDDDAISSKKPR